jgi:hypothetical protein
VDPPGCSTGATGRPNRDTERQPSLRSYPTGEQDRRLRRELAEPDRAWVPDVRVERIAEASHCLQADAPERVNQLMLDFLESIRGQRSCPVSLDLVRQQPAEVAVG